MGPFRGFDGREVVRHCGNAQNVVLSMITMVITMMMMMMMMMMMSMIMALMRRRKMVVIILMMITITLMNSKMQTLHESLRPKYERHQSKKINKTIPLVYIPLAVVS